MTTKTKAANLKFDNYDEALAWIKQKGKEYGGVRRFQASKEFAEAHPQIDELYRAAKSKAASKAASAAALRAKEMAECGISAGDVVVRTFAGAFLSVETRRGVVQMRKGNPIVKLDYEMPVQTKSGRVSYRKTLPWDKNWIKA